MYAVRSFNSMHRDASFLFTPDLDCTRSVQEVGVKNVNEMNRTEEV